MRIIFFLACWKRPEITELCFMGLKRLMKYKPEKFQCSAFAVISEESMIPLCEKYDIEFLMYNNDPVGMKKNAGLSKVLEKDFDYVIELGSDDLILNEVLDLYLPHMKKGEDFFGCKNLLMIDATDGNARQWFYDPDLVQGLGRCMSKKLLMEFTDCVWVKMKTSVVTENAIISIGEEGFLTKQEAEVMVKNDWADYVDSPIKAYLWDKINRGLDNNSTSRIMRKGFKFKTVETPEPMMADLKSDENIWAFNPDLGDKADLEKFLKGLTQQEKSLFFANQKKLKAKRVEQAV